jgi:hypothetical protein
MLISLHIPKTAGASFGRALKQHFGERLLEIYTEEPLEWPRSKRNFKATIACVQNAIHGFPGVDCIHGHILPFKYRLLNIQHRDLKFITWMRHPADRLVSSYFFMKKVHQSIPPTDQFHCRILDEQWTLERFCLDANLRNLCTQYMWGFPPERFDFVGVVEHYESDLNYFAKAFLNTTLPVFYENSQSHRSEVTYALDPGFRTAIEQFHDRDMRFYQQALEARTTRV